MANLLTLNVRLYQDGMIRIVIDEPGSATDRFSISEHGVGVEEHQLHQVKPLKDFSTIHSDSVQL